MKPMITIASAGLCAGLLALASLPALGQEPYDLSKAKEFRTVWKMPLQASAGIPRYIPSICGNDGVDLLIVPTSTTGRQFRTRPKIDVNDQFAGWGSAFMPFDYDGVPPLEYLNVNGRVDRCLSGGEPYARERIDTINCWASNINPEYPIDVDNDGFLDVACDIAGAGKTAHFIMGGPHWGKGCNRVVALPRTQSRMSSSVRAFFRSANGRWRVIQKERNPSELAPWMMIYDVDIHRDGDSLKTTFTKLDSLWGGSSSVDDEPFGNVEVLVDTVAKRDYFLLQRAVRFNPVVVAVERFDVTEGRFTSTGEKVTGMTFVMNHNLGYELGTDKPVIAITSSSGTLFCYADNIREPFARWVPTGTGVQPVAGWAVINDQTGDGKPDIVITGGAPSDGNLVLISLDPTVSVQDDSQPVTEVPTARLTGDVLEITLSIPAMVSADLVTTDGRMSLALAPVQGQPGQNRYDLAATLRSLPTGAYYLRVRMGDVSHTIPVIR